MAVVDLPPGIVCSVVSQEIGDRLEVRGRVLSPQVLHGSYVLQIKRNGPSGSSSIKQGGAFDAPADKETFLGLASFNVEPGVTVSTDFSLQIENGVKRCTEGGQQ